jgi:hypothetical protein
MSQNCNFVCDFNVPQDEPLSRRVGTARGRVRRIAIVAVARKLLVALWRYVTQGVVPEGAVLKG